MDAQRALVAVDFVLLQLRHVVGDVIDLMQIRIIGVGTQHFGKRFAYEVREHLPICEGIVRCACHGREITAPFGGIEGRTDELAIGEAIRGGVLDISFRGGALDRVVLLDDVGEVASVDVVTIPVALPDHSFTRVRIFPRPREKNADVYPVLDSVVLSR